MENIVNMRELLCEIFTAEGKPCAKMARLYNKETKKLTCNRHHYICQKRYGEYKSVCDQLKESKSCKPGMTTQELRKILKFIKQCKLQRMDFVNVCCERTTDAGHAYMIIRLDQAEKKCSRLLKN